MLYKIFILSLFLCNAIIGYSQTKLVAHKSHSGTMSNFHIAMDMHTVKMASSNFGLDPTMYLINKQLDTLKYISNNQVIFITSQEHIPNSMNDTAQRFYRTTINHIHPNSTISRNNPLDSIKKNLKEEYHFKNSMDEVVFIGYDTIIEPKVKEESKEKIESKKEQGSEKKNNLPPIIHKDNNNHGQPALSPHQLGYIIIILLALLIAFIGKTIYVQRPASEI